MHLSEIIALRTVPAAALCLGLTQRCPLNCRHCSTNSTLGAADYSQAPFRRIVGTFTEECHPELVVMSGGEALLKAELVRWVGEASRRVGTSTQLISGMYFARERRTPPAVRRAIDAVDHLSASIDVFHEEEVSRADVLRVLREYADEGKDLSVHLVGLDDEDPYLTEAIADIREQLGDRVPIAVNHVGSLGRAAEWLDAPGPVPPWRSGPEPCMLASWPLVRYDGAVLACCKQEVVDMPVVPEHLLLGHAGVDDWETIRSRTLSRDLLRAIRVVGPRSVRPEAEGSVCGYCETCYGLGGDPAARRSAEKLMARPTMTLVERTAERMLREAGPEHFVRTYASPRFADLITIGGLAAGSGGGGGGGDNG
ncbi:MAG TPA: radical SAM protein [Actinocrinis sp.]|uniref:radical SAM protein n=1 Tax=Actinocrinis sp. TaxID=1920516 RepID=UPI002DDCAD80|nr:radical SAM protein [Actinocrinis sp.]HEV2344270.1 radical SAM protein [Actinocrinis sp.]